jgi:hypothetical protein
VLSFKFYRITYSPPPPSRCSHGRATELDGGLRGREARTSELHRGERKRASWGLEEMHRGDLGHLQVGLTGWRRRLGNRPARTDRASASRPTRWRLGRRTGRKRGEGKGAGRGGWAVLGGSLRARTRRERLGRAAHWPVGPHGGRIGWVERGTRREGGEGRGWAALGASFPILAFSYFPIF